MSSKYYVLDSKMIVCIYVCMYCKLKACIFYMWYTTVQSSGVEVTPGNLVTSSDNNIIHDIKINEEYANLVPQLSISEYESFKEDIKQNGVQVPIITNQDGVILDGHHRYRAWVIDLGRLVTEMPKPTVAGYNDKLQEKMFVINVNLKRRQLNSFQRISLALKAKPILEEIAKRNQKARIKIDNDTSVRNQTQVGCGGGSGGGGRVDEQIGKRAGGVGKDTVRKVEIILEKGTEVMA
jgi:hypothetical protein